jgi:hypothetical protein
MGGIIYIRYPRDVDAAVAALVELGYEVERQEEMIDDCSNAVFFTIEIRTALDEATCWRQLESLFDRYEGDVSEFGVETPPAWA